MTSFSNPIFEEQGYWGQGDALHVNKESGEVEASHALRSFWARENGGSPDDMGDNFLYPMGISLNVLSISEVDTVKGHYGVRVKVYGIFFASLSGFGASDWRHADELTEEAKAKIYEGWTSMLTFDNKVDMQKEKPFTAWKTMKNDETGIEVETCFWYFEAALKIRCDFDLGNFPFDSQELPVTLILTDPHSVLVTLADCCKIYPEGEGWRNLSVYDVFKTEPTVLDSIQEFMWHPPLMRWQLVDPPYSKSALVVLLKVQRNGMAFIKRYLSVMCLLTILSLAPFIARPPMELADMLGFLVGLLFAAVGYQLIVANFLPHMNKLSLMDYYTLFMFGFIMISILDLTISTFVEDDALSADDLDRHAIALTGVYFAFHIAFFSFLYKRYHTERSKLQRPTPKKTGISKTYVRARAPIQFELVPPQEEKESST
eukprot:m.41559 g.41559  ORF g.41559 m.41559 type:complete len:430 (-) comp9780_c0_seq1:19-1308(-)